MLFMQYKFRRAFNFDAPINKLYLYDLSHATGTEP